MKENSGLGKAKNNNRDVTLDEHDGVLDETKNDDFDIAGNATVRGEKTSPSSRGRGETSATDRGVSHDGHNSR